MNAPAKTRGLFTDDDFDRTLLPVHLRADVRDIIEMAVAMGWKLHIASANGVTITAPEDRKKYHFGVNNRASNNLNRIRRDIFKFGDPAKVLIADSIIGMKNKKLQESAAAFLPRLGDEGTVVDHRPQIEQEQQEAERVAAEQAERRRQDEEAAAKKVAEAPKPRPLKAVSSGNRHIISSKPMVSKAKEGLGYDSPVAVERLWSDGTKDYKCQRCDFTSDKRQGVIGHNARAHGQVSSGKPQTYQADTSGATPYAPRQTRIDALAQHIADAMAAGATDPQALAKEALTWVHDQTRKGTRFSEDRVEGTPEETLERIRTLLDDGSWMRTQERLTEVEQRLLDAERRAAEAEAAAEQAKENLRTFRELVNELGE